MSILDTIIDGHSAIPTGTSEPPAFRAAIATDVAVSQFGRSLPFRGQLKDVRDTTNGEFLTRADLAWKVHTMPVAAIGARGQRVIPGYQALVRGDTGETLSITSDRFKSHQNSEIVDGIAKLADVGQAKLCYAGPIDSGRKIVCIAQLAGEFTLPNERGSDGNFARAWNGHTGNKTPLDGEDQTALFAVISGGHEPGTPFKVRGMAFRKWCGNGAFFTVGAAATFTCTHRVSIGSADANRLCQTYDDIRAQFETYGETAKRLQRTAMEREQARLYVAELLMPGAAEKIGVQLNSAGLAPSGVWQAVADSARGKQVLNKLIADATEAGEGGFARQGKHLLDAIVDQDGSNGANLWSGYNGITWHVDHVRGRNAASGVDGSLFGAGAVLKERALETAKVFAGVGVN